MKSKITLFFLLTGFYSSVNAQGLRLMFEDVLYGTLSGAALASSVMASQGEFNADHFRWGAGVGILAGAGFGVWDAMQSKGETGYYIDGLGGPAGTTGFLVLMDTGYGAATGILLGLSYSLLAQQPLTDSMLKGYAYGIWGGMAFGFVDAFVIARSSDMPFGSASGDFYSSARPKGIYIQPPSAMLAARPMVSQGVMALQPVVAARVIGVNVRF